MAFMTDLGLGDESYELFGELNDIHFFDSENLELKSSISRGRESVCSEMSDGSGPSQAIESETLDFETMLRESGITIDDEANLIIPQTALLEPVLEENQEIEAPSEAPGSPQSVSDVESYFAPSPAPSNVSRRTRSSTRVRVASLSTVNEEAPIKNKAALQAKINREKKKAYIATLEQERDVLEKENKDLKDSNQRLNAENISLNDEISYLKSVLKNQSTLSNLLQNIPNVQGVHLTTSFQESRKRSAAHDHDYGALPAKRSRTTEATAVAQTGGVCLHVAGDRVSVEFCRTCAVMANQASPNASSSSAISSSKKS